MKKVKDLKQEDIKPGLKILSITGSGKIGVVSRVDPSDDDYAWVIWGDNVRSYGGFYGTDCECEVVELAPSDDDLTASGASDIDDSRVESEHRT